MLNVHSTKRIPCLYSTVERPRIAIVGEAAGEKELQKSRPFTGPAGTLLSELLRIAGIIREECHITNVLPFRPLENDLKSLCLKKADANKEYIEWLRQGKPDPMGATEGLDLSDVSWPERYVWQPIAGPGNYLAPHYLWELVRLRKELESIEAELVIPVGNGACWALLDNPKIGKLRGTETESTLLPGQRLLPTYHPAAVLRMYQWKPIVAMDLMKANRLSKQPGGLQTPNRVVYVPETITELWQAISQLGLLNGDYMAWDIETKPGFIECISFSGEPNSALIVPFYHPDGGHYWPTPEEEAQAWKAVESLLQSAPRKVTQNGLFDTTRVIMESGIQVNNWLEDTMLMHHSLYPEMQKDLGFLGSVYTDEASWKLLRPRGHDVAKSEE